MGELISLSQAPKIKDSGASPRKKGVRYRDLRPREHLEYEEVMRLVRAAGKTGRNRLRDQTMILMAYVHGLRAREVCELRWHQIDLLGRNPSIHVLRLKGSKDSLHHLEGDELRLLRRLERGRADSPYVFAAENGNSLSVQGLWQIVKRAGDLAGFAWPIHPHMLRHACGHVMAEQDTALRRMQEWMGHVNVQHTVHYTALGTQRFRGISLTRPNR